MNMPAQDNTLRGIGLLIIATLFFAFQDTFTKQLIGTVSVFQIVCVRFFFFSVFALAVASRRVGLRNSFRSANPPLQILRALLITTEIGIFAYALQFLGIAEMHALFACFPLLITALSVPFLGEQVGWRRWIAVLIGFVGTLIIIQPGVGVFNPWSLVALVAALMFAFYNIITRKVSRTDRFETSLVYFGVVGFLSTLIAMPFVWATPTEREMWFLLAVSFTAIVGHYCLIKALEMVPAVVLQPFNYFVLVWAIILGYLVYGEVLEPLKWLGAIIVVGSGVFIARREYRIKVVG